VPGDYNLSLTLTVILSSFPMLICLLLIFERPFCQLCSNFGKRFLLHTQRLSTSWCKAAAPLLVMTSVSQSLGEQTADH
jgi:hypothetical protein